MSSLIHKGWLRALQFDGVTSPSLPGIYRGKIRYDPEVSYVKRSSYCLFNQGNFMPFTYASNQRNELIALCNRALKQTPEVDKKCMKEFSSWVHKNLFYFLPGFKKHWPATLANYLKNSNATPVVKAAIARAGERLESLGIGVNTHLSKDLQYKFTQRKAFIKMENNIYRSRLDINWKPPRLIQGAQPEFIALVGPTFMTIQAELKRVMSLGHCGVFTSGVDARDAASYLDVPGWKVFENDVSSWDASICLELCKLECWIAKKLGAGRAVTDLMLANCYTHGKTTHGIRYSIKGTRKSGDPYTSCFNSLLNFLLHMFCIFKGGVPMRDIKKVVRMLVQGDDNLMVHAPAISPKFDLLLKLGFKADNIYRRSLIEAEFCSNFVYRMDDGSYSFGPKLGRILVKLMVFIDPPLNVDPLCIARGVALGHYACAAFVPGLKRVLDRVLELTIGKKEYVDKRLAHSMCYRAVSGLNVENVYWSQERYNNYVFRDSFDRFWSNAQFGDNLEIICHIPFFEREHNSRQ